MKSSSRKNVLRLAKDKIEKEMFAKWEDLQSKFVEERDKEDTDYEKLRDLTGQLENLASEIHTWKKSKKAKKKASIEWKVDADGVKVGKQKKAVRTISDPEAIRNIRKTNRSNRPRAGAWLQEGGLVVQRGKDTPMMVLSINSDGVVQVLDGGQVRWLRELSLRPAMDID